MTVDRCVCHNLSFAHLLQMAREAGHDFDTLKRATGCATNCAMCEPYIRLMLDTGRTRLPILSEKAVREVLRRSAESAGNP